MIDHPQTQGIAIVCDTQGGVRQILRDDLNLVAPPQPIANFTSLFDRASAAKAAQFIAAVIAQGAAFDWQLNACLQNRMTMLHFFGSASDKGLLLLGVRSSENIVRFQDEMSRINNEHVNVLRETIRQQTVAPPRNDPPQIEAMSELNNELVNMQRELGRKNAELMRVNLELHRVNSELEDTRAKLEENHEKLLAANAKLADLAATDSLTGIPNRRTLEQSLQQAFYTAKLENRPLSVAMIDIDHFKSLNDTFGHAAGDEALQQLAGILSETVRDSDLVARLGGEEFAVILRDAAGEKAHQAADRLRQAIESATWPDRPITVSIGLATLRPEHTSFEALLEHADEALYTSKETGRNRV
ncbi:MAG: GGDEF domain-containing protein, partial [Phycisphaeraceae bacterium]